MPIAGAPRTARVRMQSATCATDSQRIQRSSPGRARWSSTSRAPSLPAQRFGCHRRRRYREPCETVVEQLEQTLRADGAWVEGGLDRQAVDERDERGRLPLCVDRIVHEALALRRRERLADALAPEAVCIAAGLGECRAGLGQAEEREPDTHLGASLAVDREALDELRAQELERVARVLGGLDDAAADAVGHGLEGEQEQLLLVLEVVRHGAGGPARLGGDAAHRHGVEALARGEPPHGGGELGAALRVIDDLGHDYLSELYRTYDINKPWN